jgi:hypothetical protein
LSQRRRVYSIENLQKSIRWWAQKDLNLRPADYEEVGGG